MTSKAGNNSTRKITPFPKKQTKKLTKKLTTTVPIKPLRKKRSLSPISKSSELTPTPPEVSPKPSTETVEPAPTPSKLSSDTKKATKNFQKKQAERIKKKFAKFKKKKSEKPKESIKETTTILEVKPSKIQESGGKRWIYFLSKKRLSLLINLILFISLLMILNALIDLILFIALDLELNRYRTLINGDTSIIMIPIYLFIFSGCQLIIGFFSLVVFSKIKFIYKNPDYQGKYEKLWYNASLINIASLIFTILSLVIVIACKYNISRLEPILKKNILSSMNLYNSDLKHKETLNWLQIDYECCGSSKHSDWFKIEWYSHKNDLPLIYDHTTQGYDVPFSCCKKDYLKPCINYNLLKDASNQDMMTIYTKGCSEAVNSHLEFLEQFIVNYRFLMIIAMMIFTYLTRIISTHYRSKFIEKLSEPYGYILPLKK